MHVLSVIIGHKSQIQLVQIFSSLQEGHEGLKEAAAFIFDLFDYYLKKGVTSYKKKKGVTSIPNKK